MLEQLAELRETLMFAGLLCEKGHDKRRRWRDGEEEHRAGLEGLGPRSVCVCVGGRTALLAVDVPPAGKLSEAPASGGSTEAASRGHDRLLPQCPAPLSSRTLGAEL